MTPKRGSATQTFSRKQLYEKSKPVNMSLSMRVRQQGFIPGYEQVESPIRNKSHKQQKDNKNTPKRSVSKNYSSRGRDSANRSASESQQNQIKKT